MIVPTIIISIHKVRVGLIFPRWYIIALADAVMVNAKAVMNIFLEIDNGFCWES